MKPSGSRIGCVTQDFDDAIGMPDLAPWMNLPAWTPMAPRSLRGPLSSLVDERLNLLNDCSPAIQ